MYWLIQSYGINDSRFNHENFGKQPRWLVLQCIDFFEEQKRKTVNAAAMTDAIGWTSLMNGFSGANGAKTPYQAMLPYKEQMPQTDLMDSTFATLVELVESHQLPPWAEGLAMGIDSVREAVDGN